MAKKRKKARKEQLRRKREIAQNKARKRRKARHLGVGNKMSRGGWRIGDNPELVEVLPSLVAVDEGRIDEARDHIPRMLEHDFIEQVPDTVQYQLTMQGLMLREVHRDGGEMTEEEVYLAIRSRLELREVERNGLAAGERPRNSASFAELADLLDMSQVELQSQVDSLVERDLAEQIPNTDYYRVTEVSWNRREALIQAAMPLVEAVEEMAEAEEWIRQYVAELDSDYVRQQAQDVKDIQERKSWQTDVVARYSEGDLVLGFDARGRPAGAMQLYEADALMKSDPPLKTGWGIERLDIRSSWLYMMVFGQETLKGWPIMLDDDMDLFIRYCWGTPLTSAEALAKAQRGLADGTYRANNSL